MSFKELLKFGQKYEKRALSLFRYETAFSPPGLHSEYDFILNDWYKVEVKADKLASLTGNLCIEFQANGKPSGTSVSTAHVWVIYAVGSDDVYKIKLKRLKRLCDKYGTKRKGGYKNLSEFYLLPASKCKKYLVNIEDVVKLLKQHDPAAGMAKN